jgi:hypothetical protein
MFSDFSFYDLVGLCGVVCSLYCYGRVQWRRDFAKHLSYSVLNFLASIFLIFSLMHRWNLSSFVINIAWGIISLYGVYRCTKYIRHARNKA